MSDKRKGIQKKIKHFWVESKSFFSFKNKRLNHIAYPAFAVLFLCLVMFQNCKTADIITTDKASTEDTPASVPTTHPTTSSTTPPTPPSNQPLGSLTSYLQGDTQKALKDQFNVGQTAALEFINFHQQSQSFQWTVSRGFAVITNAQATSSSTFQTTLNQKGAYDVLSTSHSSNSDVLSRANKRLIAGAECDPSHILEIKLQSGSLYKGQTVTFTLDNTQDSAQINWKVQQSSQNPVEQNNQSSITVNLADQVGTLTVEVTAVDADTQKSSCLTYRKQEFSVGNNLEPHFDFVRPVDDTYPVTLENNDIYKYKRTSQSKYIQVHITDGRDCLWNGNSVTCNGGRSDITQEDLDISACTEAVGVAQASYFDASNTLTTKQRSYYKFCPKDQDLCYFGPIESRPQHHSCVASASVRSTGVTSSPTPTSVCSSTQTPPNYKAVNGECLKSCAFAGGTHTGTDCEDTDNYEIVLLVGTYESPCCKRTKKTSSNGACDNSVQNGCSRGRPVPQASSGGFFRWHCLGENGGTDATDCQLAQPVTAVNGQCNNLIINGCNPGNAISQPPSEGFNKWHCNGINGGTNATDCQKGIAEDGQCDNTTKYACLSGEPSNRTEGDDAYTWHCTGLHGGVSVTNCSKGKPVNGTCDNTKKNGCLTGKFDPSSANQTTTHDTWTCQGLNGGTDDANCQKLLPVNGACDNTKKNGCSVGSFDPLSATTSGGFHRWHCNGKNGGINATDCQIASGSLCNYPDTITDYINSCRSGATFSDRIDDNDYYKWACGSENCKRLKPFHGECSTTPGQCTRGVAGTVSTHIESYANSGFYILPEVAKPILTTSKTINDANEYSLSTLDARIWSCEGGLSKAYCRAHQGFTAECPTDPPIFNANNDFINYCRQGYVYQKSSDQIEYTWRCRGTNSNSTDNCTRQKLTAPPASSIKSQGECSFSRNQCRGGNVKNRASTTISYKYVSGRKYDSTLGQYVPNIQDGNRTLYTWECEGAVGSTSNKQKCKQITSTFDGVCDNTNTDSCAGGILYNLDDSDTHYRWICFGHRKSDDKRTQANVPHGHIVYCSKPKFQVINETDGTQTIRAF